MQSKETLIGHSRQGTECKNSVQEKKVYLSTVALGFNIPLLSCGLEANPEFLWSVSRMCLWWKTDSHWGQENVLNPVYYPLCYVLIWNLGKELTSQELGKGALDKSSGVLYKTDLFLFPSDVLKCGFDVRRPHNGLDWQEVGSTQQSLVIFDRRRQYSTSSNNWVVILLNIEHLYTGKMVLFLLLLLLFLKSLLIAKCLRWKQDPPLPFCKEQKLLPSAQCMPLKSVASENTWSVWALD